MLTSKSTIDSFVESTVDSTVDSTRYLVDDAEEEREEDKERDKREIKEVEEKKIDYDCIVRMYNAHCPVNKKFTFYFTIHFYMVLYVFRVCLKCKSIKKMRF